MVQILTEDKLLLKNEKFLCLFIFYSQDDFGKILSENRKISKNFVVILAFCTKNITHYTN